MAVLIPPPQIRPRKADASPRRSDHGPQATDERAWLPALDGLRGVAVIAVLLFHGGWSWASGGYLGVSVFFTLSGFLVARLVLADERDPVSLVAHFWSRRVRRLAPALGLVLVGVGGATAAGWLPRPTVRTVGDLVAAAGQVANWRFVRTGDDYAALFDAPSPVLHLWSLSVEAQLYLVVPVLLVALGRGRRRRTAVGVAVLAAASLVAVVMVPMSAARAYYGTDVRALETLAGVGVGIWLAHGHRPGPAAQRVVRWTAPAAMAFLAVVASTWSVDELRIDQGWLVPVAAASAVVVAAGALDTGVVARGLAWSPLRRLGVISYGLYLIHWPVFIALNPGRTGLDGGGSDGLVLFGLRVAVSVALAVVSYVAVETRIRAWRRLPARAMVTATAMAVFVAVVLVGSVTPTTDLAAAAGSLTRIDEAVAAPEATVPAADAPVVLAGPRRILVAGDSQAVRLATGLRIWGGGDPRVISAADLGCGIGRGGEVRYHDTERAIFDDCTLWRDDFPQLLARLAPDIVVVVTGPWDYADRRLSPTDAWRSPGDPVYDDYLVDELVDAGRRLSATGVPVVWLTSPPSAVGRQDLAAPAFPTDGPARAENLNRLIETAAATNGTEVIDYAGFLATCPGGVLDAGIRPDGVHLERDSSVMVAEWLAPQLLDRMANPPGADEVRSEPRGTCTG